MPNQRARRDRLTTKKRLVGLYAATFTPLHSDGSLHLDEVPRMVSYLERQGIEGIYVCGSTGEGVSLLQP